MLCNIFMPGELFSFLPFIRKINFPFYIQILVLNFALFARFLTSVCLKSFSGDYSLSPFFLSRLRGVWNSAAVKRPYTYVTHVVF